MEFPLDQETEGGTQNFLMKLRKKQTHRATPLTEAFYDRIIENYDYGENYYIILIHAVDIPGKSSDGAEMFDASDEIYDHIPLQYLPGQALQSRPALQCRDKQY